MKNNREKIQYCATNKKIVYIKGWVWVFFENVLKCGLPVMCTTEEFLSLLRG